MKKNIIILTIGLLSTTLQAQVKLLNSEPQEKPEWVHNQKMQPNSSKQYSVNVGYGEGETLEKAMFSAYQDIANQNGLMVYDIDIEHTRTVFLKKGRHVYEIKIPEEYFEYWVNYSGDKLYKYYILCQVALKPGKSNFKKLEFGKNYSTEFRPVIPFACSQYYSGETTKANILAATQLLGLVYGTYHLNNYLSLRSEYQNTSDSPITQNKLNQDMNKTRIHMLSGFALFATAYTYGLVDGFFNKNGRKPKWACAPSYNPNNNTLCLNLHVKI